MTLEAPVRIPEDKHEDDDQAIKERHLKRLEELSLKTAGQKPQLEEPTDEQKKWVERRMKGSARTWKRWNEGIYFTEEQGD